MIPAMSFLLEMCLAAGGICLGFFVWLSLLLRHDSQKKVSSDRHKAIGYIM
jgi:hypothetical protein